MAYFRILLYDLVSDMHDSCMVLSGLTPYPVLPLSIVASSFPLRAICFRLSFGPPNTKRLISLLERNLYNYICCWTKHID